MTALQRIAAADVGPAWLVFAAWGICILLGAWVGGRKGRPTAGAILGLLCGPLGVAICLVLPHAGNMRCPSCGKRARWVPKSSGSGPPGTSEPHLRCSRCGEIIWNEGEAMIGDGFFSSLMERILDLAYRVYTRKR